MASPARTPQVDRRRPLLEVAIVAVGLTFWTAALARPLGDAWLEGPLGDDAYYYLAVARNIAGGEGSTYGGELTNGYQPLQMVAVVLLGELTGWGVWQAPFALFVWNMTVYFLLGPLVLLRALRSFSHDAPYLRPVALVLWCFSPMAALTYLGLETPLALVAWVAVFAVFLDFGREPTRYNALLLGATIGLAFLCRNDSVFLAIGCGALLACGRRSRAVTTGLAVAALVSLVPATPWLLFNLYAFDSLIPQSGHAEAVGALYDRGRGAQLEATAKAVGRHLVSLTLPLDRLWEASGTAGALGCLVLVVGGSVGALVPLRSGSRTQRLVYTGLLLGVAFLVAIYLVAFGAPHMVPRWIAPVGLVGLLWIGVVAGAGPVRALAVCALAISMSAGKLAGGYREKTATNTYGLARFLEDVPCETRPAALQSGLPHWLNPCVENIDGKVNKGALSAILAGRYGEWLAQQRFGIIADSELFGYEEHPAVKSAYTPGSGPRNLIVLEATRPRVAPSNAGDGTDLSGGG